MASLSDRMIRAARLDATLYEEVEADQTTMGQATTVVLISAFAGGLAMMAQSGTIIGLITGMLSYLIAWYFWAFVTYVIGTRLLPTTKTEANFGQLLRTIGFSAAPGVIRVLGIVSPLANISFAIANVWGLIAMVVAVRQALDYDSTWRAVAVCFIGWVAQVLLLILLVMLVGGPADMVTAPVPVQ